jgi:hypothetical protein
MMQNRYRKPPFFDAPPRLESLPDVLRDAMLTDVQIAEDNGSEADRREAVDALLKFARAEVAEVRAKAARAHTQLAEAIARRGVEKADAYGIAEALARYGVDKAGVQSIADRLISWGVEKADAQGIAEGLVPWGGARADTQGIAKDMLALASVPLKGCEEFERNPRHYAWTFLAEAWLRILTAEDPVAELKRFLGRKRGRPADNEWRDFMITIDVQERVDSGLCVNNACAAVGDDIHLSPDAVEKIYYAHRGNPGVQDKVLRRQFLDFADRSHGK